ncbi:glycerophosphodiester phosphodiesterase family protein [Wenxinia marina]|uniref:Glycerophosphoryl diester phosphodiesterase n=1 Tax=Wenxinia marina DSM 24838 TaxID=1123501 RepID=A0A0D0QIF9_9RHOB|nr:glycerophosphodiester phosphodiesterase family protein [Wenxinia marina]KIQ70843.1 Glycerophosphoryl diester phosphodiesterase [Wenxinia marina DSM 24838]GGL56880.1 phosphodiesterase [Wenxinia marina]
MSRVPLPQAFLRRPIAHRAYHDRAAGRPENSAEAIRAAVEAGYGIEVDVQLTEDGAAVVFHDDDLKRLTGVAGPVRGRTASALADLPLLGGTTGAPTLVEALGLVQGRVPLLVEIKDQDGAMSAGGVGPLEEATARALHGYEGEVAVMSFNPHSVAAMADLAPDVPRGLTTSAYDPDGWPTLPAGVRDRLRGIPDYDGTGASFISHEAADLSRPRVAELKAAGAAILTWTIRSAAAERAARAVADNVTFEGYPA